MLRARPNTGVSSPSSSPSSSRYFVNIVCVRTDLSGDPTFAQLAQRTARKVRRKRGEVTEEKETSSLCAVCCMLCCCIVLCRMTSCSGHACDECGSPAAFYSLLQPLTASYSLLQHGLTRPSSLHHIHSTPKQPINTSKQPIKIDAFKVPFRADAVVPAGPMRRPVYPRHGPCLRPGHHHLQPSHHGGALSRGGGGVRCDAFVR